MPYLVKAFGPGDGDMVPLRRRCEAERGLLGRGAVTLAVEVHEATELAVAAGVLAGHVVDLLGGAGVDDGAVAGAVGGPVEEGEEAIALAGVGGGGGAGEGTAPGGGEGVAEGGEDEDEEYEHGGEEGGRDEVQESPLPPRAAPRRREVHVPHALPPPRRIGSRKIWDPDQRPIGSEWDGEGKRERGLGF